MRARIYKPARTAMQSGHAATHGWFLEFELKKPCRVEPLMGWTSSNDTLQQLRLRFSTRKEAMSYAKRNAISFIVLEPQERRIFPASYASNFHFKRSEGWTH
ncbi:MAG: ETC complex I subunit [Alphaproteobacteria bacterium]|nr:ETC complex I subunit [Alphaproteobacteria bacterium]